MAKMPSSIPIAVVLDFEPLITQLRCAADSLEASLVESERLARWRVPVYCLSCKHIPKRGAPSCALGHRVILNRRRCTERRIVG